MILLKKGKIHIAMYESFFMYTVRRNDGQCDDRVGVYGIYFIIYTIHPKKIIISTSTTRSAGTGTRYVSTPSTV